MCDDILQYILNNYIFIYSPSTPHTQKVHQHLLNILLLVQCQLVLHLFIGYTIL